jgi:hypothetical protein
MMSQTLISKSCLVCFIYFLVSCTTSLQPVAIYTTPEIRVSTEISSNDLKNIILGTSAPQESKVGGISGCFSASTSRPPSAINYFVFYNVFRFYNDGTVIGVKVGIDTDTIFESWDEIKIWFNQNNEKLAKGNYRIGDNQIWFIMSDKGHMMAEYYYGVLHDNSMVLNSHNQRDGSEEEKNVEYLELECASQ